MYSYKNLIPTIILSVVMAFSAIANANSHTENKVVIQVSSADPLIQKIALNNAVNIQKVYGIDDISIEIVAYGPGLGLLTKKSTQALRVSSLALQDITFSACGNTMKKVEKKTGKSPVLLEGVGSVPSGAVRIIELQQQGYAYIRP